MNIPLISDFWRRIIMKLATQIAELVLEIIENRLNKRGDGTLSHTN